MLRVTFDRSFMYPSLLSSPDLNPGASRGVLYGRPSVAAPDEWGDALRIPVKVTKAPVRYTKRHGNEKERTIRLAQARLPVR